MDRIILHIGYPKTGTSSIQTTFLSSRKSLSQACIFFPNVHAGLCNAVAGRFYTRPQSLFPYCDLPQEDAIIKECIERDFSLVDLALQESKCDVGIISSESLIALEFGNIQRLRSWLLTRADAVTIVCYVRRPSSYAASVIQERVKWGERLPHPALTLPIGKFEHQLPYWVAAFGKENMIVRSACREDLLGHDVVTDFAQLIGFNGELDRSTEYKNEGISHAAVMLLDALNAIDNRLVAGDSAFRELWKLPGTKYRLSSDLLQSVELQARPHLRYLCDQWGIHFQDDTIASAEANTFSAATALCLAEFIVELHKQTGSSEPSPFRERW